MHELACLRNALRDAFALKGWRWLHRIPKTVGERLDRELDRYQRSEIAFRAARIERVLYEALNGKPEHIAQWGKRYESHH